MIYTVTLNPSVDYVISLDNLNKGAINITNEENVYPGGKGINVSRVLNNLNIPSIAVGFIAGFTGEYIKNFLDDEKIKNNLVKVNGNTRINVKIKCDEETEINGNGPEISKKDLDKLLSELDNLKTGDVLVLSGSIPKALPVDIYSQIIDKVSHKDIKVVIDTTKDKLLDTLKYNPFFIKPNKHELEEIFNVEIKSIDDVICYANKLVDMGAQNVVVSMAGDGALLINKNNIYKALPPKGKVKNSVGAGDSLVAGFIGTYTITNDLVSSFKFGVACGSASAFSYDLCTEESVNSLIEQVLIEKLK